MKANLATPFPAYTDYDPAVPVHRISLGARPAIHRFYDTSPLSPSGQYIAYTEFDFEDRLPEPGDEASVVVVDLGNGEEIYRTRTKAWDTQLGAQVQWGIDDQSLFFNRMEAGEWSPYGVKVDPKGGNEFHLEGPVYMVSPDGKQALSPSLTRIWLVQPGYGVIVPPEFRPEPRGASDEDGLFITDTENGATRLLVSFRHIYETLTDQFKTLKLDEGGFYGFHAKWAPSGKRILFIIRWRDRGMRKGQSLNWIVTMDDEGKNLAIAMTPKRWVGGHHPNWCPDSEHIVMNLAFRNRRRPFPRLLRLTERIGRKLGVNFHSGAYDLRFATFRFDGANLSIAAPSQFGSGHPTWHAKLGSILTDAYPSEIVAAGDGTVPIRLVSPTFDHSETLIRIQTAPVFSGPRQEWRVDPHPAWDRSGTKLIFNGCPEGPRQVFIASLGALIEERRAVSR